MVASTMNYDQALQEVIRLKDAGLSYPKIEQHLKKAGYLSSRTRKPIGALGVRYMITANEKKLQVKNPENVDPKIEVRASGPELMLDTIKKVIDLPEISTTVKVVMIESLILEAKSGKYKKR